MGKSCATALPGQLTDADLKHMPPSDALTALLTSAQSDHKICITNAMKENADPVDKCALTWGNVLLRYKQFGAYRAPFETESDSSKYTKYWTKSRQDKDDAKIVV